MKNLKSLAVAILILLSGISFKAQSQAALLVLVFGDKAATENFHFSIDGGLNFVGMTNLVGKTQVMANFGLGTHIRLNDRWTLAPEFKPLSGRGERRIEPFVDIPEDIADEVTSAESSVRLKYLDIPVLIRYKASEHWYFAAGPQISFRTGAEALTYVTLDSGREIELNDPIKDITEWYDFSFPVEVGYNFAQNKHLGGIDIRLRFAPGFVTVYDAQGSQLKNNVTQFIISFPFLKKQVIEIIE
ncbi:porin family protein [Fulvivirga sedimenti]|uniref:PorT family protein n=1 Tax=Fulvivirga sedimenti TaxID=2879465 RepID=A0A9X1L395_9BACT|nr:porin family protein [Fulvivirga sedimenti]MCA6079051.1 PorT family protein [Fulvivirga sedimenti]